MKLNTNSHSGNANLPHSLLLTFLLSMSVLPVQPAAAQEGCAKRDHDLNPLQVALLKWRPNLTTTISVDAPGSLAFDGANIWVTSSNENTVTKLRASDGALLGTFSVGSNPYSVAFDGANIWVTSFYSNTVSKL